MDRLFKYIDLYGICGQSEGWEVSLHKDYGYKMLAFSTMRLVHQDEWAYTESKYVIRLECYKEVEHIDYLIAEFKKRYENDCHLRDIIDSLKHCKEKITNTPLPSKIEYNKQELSIEDIPF